MSLAIRTLATMSLMTIVPRDKFYNSLKHKKNKDHNSNKRFALFTWSSFSLRSLLRASLIWIITTVHQLGGLPYPTHVGWFRFVHLVNLDLFPHKIGRKSTPLSRLWEIHKLTLTPVNVVVGYWKSILNGAQPAQGKEQKNIFKRNWKKYHKICPFSFYSFP